MVEKLKAWVPERRDMIWINFNPQSGKEMKDEHPMLVISPKAFNEKTGIVIGLPMTHAKSNETNPFAIKYSVGRSEPIYILTHQPKSFDWRQRSGSRDLCNIRNARSGSGAGLIGCRLRFL